MSSSQGDDRESPSQRTPGRAIAWAAALAGPLAWFLDLSTRYFLVESGAAATHPMAVLSVGLVCLLIAAAASATGWRTHHRLARHDHGASFVALLGCALSGYAVLVILATLLPHLFFDGTARI